MIKSMLCWWPNVPTSRSPPFGLTTSRGNEFCNRCFKVLQLLITNSTTCNSFHLKLITSYQLGLKILHCTLNLTKAHKLHLHFGSLWGERNLHDSGTRLFITAQNVGACSEHSQVYLKRQWESRLAGWKLLAWPFLANWWLYLLIKLNL